MQHVDSSLSWTLLNEPSAAVAVFVYTTGRKAPVAEEEDTVTNSFRLFDGNVVGLHVSVATGSGTRIWESWSTTQANGGLGEGGRACTIWRRVAS